MNRLEILAILAVECGFTPSQSDQLMLSEIEAIFDYLNRKNRT